MKIFYLFHYCLCFSYTLHGYLGENTCSFLKKNKPILFNFINQILKENCSISSIWADKIKRTKKYYWLCGRD